MHDELECEVVKGMPTDSEAETDDHGGMCYPDKGIRKLPLRQNPGKDEVCYSTESTVFRAFGLERNGNQVSLGRGVDPAYLHGLGSLQDGLI